MAERLRRLDWLYERTPIYFVTACTHSRRKILDNPSVHECLQQFAANGTSRGVWLGAYVLMPDHLHAFVALDNCQGDNSGIHRPPLQLSSFMKSLKNALSKNLREHGTFAPPWQKGFFDHILRSTESYGQKWDYVRQNPVRARLVAEADDWPYQGEPFALEHRRDRV